mmetsp:Transcript_104792/g.190675  ORF Transcript_104792/g.190675 Transcript_104792/m.190675 type:complete len:120 (-) Transcript_104792:176-535(-)
MVTNFPQDLACIQASVFGDHVKLQGLGKMNFFSGAPQQPWDMYCVLMSLQDKSAPTEKSQELLQLGAGPVFVVKSDITSFEARPVPWANVFIVSKPPPCSAGTMKYQRVPDGIISKFLL